MAIMALHAAATGMKALDTKLDVTANNLANINTTGFKHSRVNFEDLVYQFKREPGLPNVDDQPIPHGIQVGLGVKVAGTQLDMEQGPVDPTDRPLDLTIEGPGFFQVRTNYDGGPIVAYTRAGNFTVNAEGNLVLGTSAGPVLEPPISIPPDTKEIEVARNGEVRVRQPGQQQLTQVGQIELARFVNPEGLKQVGGNLYLETDASGPAITGPPQLDGLGAIVAGQLEMSNVDPVRELISLITTQRAFEMNSQSIQSAEQSLQVVSNLRRF
jgi:flagellar basal-body rod protein FlgG